MADVLKDHRDDRSSRQSQAPDGRAGELAGTDSSASATRHPPRPLDPRRAERLANPDGADDEAHDLIAAAPSTTRAWESTATSPDVAADEAERVLLTSASESEDDRVAEEPKKSG